MHKCGNRKLFGGRYSFARSSGRGVGPGAACHVFLVVLVGVANPAKLVAQTDSGVDETKKKLLVEWNILVHKAELTVLAAEEAHLKAQDTPGQIAKEKDKEGLSKLLEERFALPRKGRFVEIERLQRELHGKEGKEEKAKEAWFKARYEADRFANEVKKTRAKYGIGNEQGWQFWDLSMSGIVAWGIILLVISFLLGQHGRRRQLRSRYRFNGRMGVVAGALVFCFVGLLDSSVADEKGNDAIKGKDSGNPVEKKAELEQKAAEARNDLEKKRRLHLENLIASFPGEFRSSFLASEVDAAKKFQKILHSAMLVELATKEGLRITDVLHKNKLDLDGDILQVRTRFLLKAGSKIGLSLAFVLVAFLPLLFLERKLRKEQEKQVEQCPCCLAKLSKDCLKSVTDEEADALPEPQYLQCEECDYKFRARYQKLPRLCFPAVGITESGKTHWLVTAYDMVKNHRVPVRSTIECAPSLVDAEYDKFIGEILEDRKGARKTVHTGFPYPLVFHLQDRDTWGRNAGLLNMFDFSGELMNKNIDTDRVRRRALLMDSFILFLDPTQVSMQRGGRSIRDQVRAFSNFHKEMRDMRNMEVGTAIPVPIAVCISKLDLLKTKNPLGGRAIPFIKEIRKSFVRPISLAEIGKRSRLCEEEMARMFPGWNVARTLTDNFGGRFLFFPMTAVSLEESELGESDQTRTFAPVGILEPILWLMHMHGFSVLPQK